MFGFDEWGEVLENMALAEIMAAAFVVQSFITAELAQPGVLNGALTRRWAGFKWKSF